MQISSRFSIAIHMFTCIEYFKGDYKITSEFIADSVGVNPVIIRKIMSQLRDAGLVDVARGTEKHVYHNATIRLLKVLEEKRCNWSEKSDNILEKCTGAFHDKEHEYSIIYGDYYFIEAIFKLTGQEIIIW